jgi:hypothetical protein
MKQQRFKIGDDVWEYLSDAYGARRFGVIREVFQDDKIVYVEFEDQPEVKTMRISSQLQLASKN